MPSTETDCCVCMALYLISLFQYLKFHPILQYRRSALVVQEAFEVTSQSQTFLIYAEQYSLTTDVIAIFAGAVMTLFAPANVNICFIIEVKSPLILPLHLHQDLSEVDSVFLINFHFFPVN